MRVGGAKQTVQVSIPDDGHRRRLITTGRRQAIDEVPVRPLIGFSRMLFEHQMDPGQWPAEEPFHHVGHVEALDQPGRGRDDEHAVTVGYAESTPDVPLLIGRHRRVGAGGWREPR